MKSNKLMNSVFLLAICALLSVDASAVAKPKFDGTWTLNKSESKLNDQFSFAPQKVEITQDKKSIQIVRYTDFQGQQMTTDEKMTLDGKESENEGFQGNTKICVANWDGDALKVDTKMDSEWGSIESTQVYSMEDGKLKIVSTTSTPNGDMEETWILEKA